MGASRDGASGEVRWHMEFPAQIGPPTVATLEKGGPVSILVGDSNGFVYCIR